MALTAQEIEALMPDCTELLSDEPEMESSLHYTQLLILVSCLEWLWRDREDFFIGANLTIYYANQFHTPEYFWFSPTTLELVGWRLAGSEYEKINPSENGWYWSQELGLYLGIWENKLRYFSVEGKLIPTPEEANLEEIRKVEIERQRADKAENKAAILAQKLRELGIEPDSL
jgi:Uma2 family endonuclease